jgi:hypothetical protein
MSLVTTAEFNTIRDAMITSVNAGTAMEAAWTAAATPVAAGKDAGWQANLAGLKPTILIAVNQATAKTDGLCTAEIRRLGDVYARGLAAGQDSATAWTNAKAAFPRTTDTALEAHKATALAWAADHPAGYPGA